MAEGFPVTRTVKSLGIERSLYYYHLDNSKNEDKGLRGRPFPGYSFDHHGKKISDEQIEEFLMEAVEGDEAAYGYQKLTHLLRVEHELIINEKKVYRLCKKLDILQPNREKKAKYPRRLARNHVITGSNQLWQLDIKYGSIEQSGRFFFLASAIDVFDRCIVGYYRGSHCKTNDITKMLQEALFRRDVHLTKGQDQPVLIIRTDNGPQFVSNAFGEFCEHQGVIHERIPKKTPNLNAFIESFHSILERECFQRTAFEFFDQAYHTIDEFIDFYNNRRFHGSLNYLPPMKFYELAKEGLTTQVKTISL